MATRKTTAPARKTPAKASAPATAKARQAPAKAAAQPPKGVSSDARATKPKLVRDSFTIPKSEYAVLQALKERALQMKRPTKKSEVLRAGINALKAMSDRAFLAALEAVPSLKTGRPKSSKSVTAATSKSSAAD